MRLAREIILTSQEQIELARVARSSTSSVRLAQRAHRAAGRNGNADKGIAVELGACRVRFKFFPINLPLILSI
jgi:non-canonical (house-cleaning) NTP pyrophosphatase